MILMADASTPPPSLPTTYQVIAGYLGGDTPHVWTRQEWHRFDGLKKLPIWTRSNPAQVNALDDAFACLRQLYTLQVPVNTAVALDLETAVNTAFVNTFDHVLAWAGYHLWLYGSASTVFGNPQAGGYWVADWTHQPHMYPHPAVHATQYTNGQAYDSSVVKTWQYEYRLRKW